MIYATIAVIALAAVVASKFLTTASLESLRRRAAEIDSEVRKARGALKAAENASGVADRGINTKERKKKTLEKQIDKYRKELSELKK